MRLLQVTIPNIFRRTMKKYLNKIAIKTDKMQFTYGELWSRTQALAKGLSNLGVNKGDKIAIMMRNRNELLESILGAMEIGLVVNLINFRNSSRELRHILAHSDLGVIICEEEFLEIIEEIAELNLKQIIIVGSDQNNKQIMYESLIQQHIETVNMEENIVNQNDIMVQEDDDCLILYTSGTTGKPKGVVLTQHNLVWTLVALTTEFNFNEKDIGVFLTPIFHISALIRVLTMIYVGGTIVNMNDFDPKRVLKVIEEEKVTFAFIVPTMFIMLNNYVSEHRLKFDTTSFVKYINGSGHLTLKMRKEIRDIFPQANFYNTYGMTEHPAPILLQKPGQEATSDESLRESINTEVKIIGSNLKELPVGEVGEIAVRSPAVMKGYYKDHEATSKIKKGEWLLTGDLGWRNEKGDIYLVGRSKEIIKSGGENVSPKEVEEILLEHPQIQEVAVLGVPDAKWGEAVKAFIVVKKGITLEAKEILEFCSSRMADYKKPKYLEYCTDFPKNSSGKIDKEKLRSSN